MSQASNIANTQIEQYIKDGEHIKSRGAYIKYENAFKYIYVSCVHKWCIKRTPEIQNIALYINNVMIKPSSTTKDHFIYDFGVLRKKWFDLLGNTPAENDLLAVEDLCMYNQLRAVEHYELAPKDLLFSSIFVKDIEIFFVPQFKSTVKPNQIPAHIEMEEYYLVSDIHKKTYN
jgi:hypothetical protein